STRRRRLVCAWSPRITTCSWAPSEPQTWRLRSDPRSQHYSRAPRLFNDGRAGSERHASPPLTIWFVAKLVAARSLKVFALPVRVVEVGWGRQRAFWLLHLGAARRGTAANSLGSLFPSQERFQVALADQPTASRPDRPELAGTQQVVDE